MQFNRKLLLTALLGATLFSCTKEEVETPLSLSEDDLPSLSIAEKDYLRGNDTLEIDLGEYANEQISIVDIQVSADGKTLNIDQTTTDNNLQIVFDSKQLNEGENNVTIKVSLNSDLELPSTSLSQDILVEVDNYLPLMFIEEGFIQVEDVELSGEDESIDLEWIQRFFNKEESFLVLDENFNQVTEIYKADGKEFNKVYEIPENAEGQNFMIYRIQSSEKYEYSKYLGEVLADQYEDERVVNIIPFHSQGDEFRLEANHFQFDERNERNVVLAIKNADFGELNVILNRQHVISYDDDYTYYSLEIKDAYHYFENNFAFTNNTVLIKDNSDNQGIKVDLDQLNEGDTIVVSKDLLSEPIAKELNDDVVGLYQCFEYNDLLLRDNIFCEKNGNAFIVYKFLNHEDSEISYFGETKVSPEVNNNSSFFSLVNSLDQSFTKPLDFSLQDYEITDDYIALNPFNYDTPLNIYNSVHLVIQDETIGNTIYKNYIRCSGRDNVRVVVPLKFDFEGFEEINSGKFKDFFSNNIEKVGFVTSTNFLTSLEINSFSIYSQKDL